MAEETPENPLCRSTTFVRSIPVCIVGQYMEDRALVPMEMQLNRIRNLGEILTKSNLESLGAPYTVHLAMESWV